MLKDMVKAEAAGSQQGKQRKDEEEEDGKKKLKFSATMAKILLKHFEEVIGGRGVFILLELVENEATRHLVAKQLKS